MHFKLKLIYLILCISCLNFIAFSDTGDPWPEISDLNVDDVENVNEDESESEYDIEDDDITCIFQYKLKSGHIFYIRPDLRGVIYHPIMKNRVSIFTRDITEDNIENEDYHSFKFSISENKFTVQYIVKSNTLKKIKGKRHSFTDNTKDQLFCKLNFTCSSTKISYFYQMKSLVNLAPWYGVAINILEHPKDTKNIKQFRKKNSKAILMMHTIKKHKKPFSLKILEDTTTAWGKYHKKYKAKNQLKRVDIFKQRSFKKLIIQNHNSSSNNYFWYQFLDTGALGNETFNVIHHNQKGMIGIENKEGMFMPRTKKNKVLNYKGSLVVL